MRPFSWFICGVSLALGTPAAIAQTPGVSTPALSARPDTTASANALAAYRANRACMIQMRQAIQAGASETERAGIVQNCIARGKAMAAPNRDQRLAGGQGLPDWIAGINYEKAGRYPEAAAVYQKILNDEGYPNGDGLLAGERLGFLYANGLGVSKNEAKARQLFSVRDSQRNRTDLALMAHNMLPTNPEGVPAATKRMEEADRLEARKGAVAASQPITADYTFICHESDDPHPKIVTIDSRHKMVKVEETTLNTELQCTILL